MIDWFANLHNEVIDPKVPLTSILLKAKALATAVDNHEFRDWILKEQNGYSEDDVVPTYRNLPVSVRGRYVGLFQSMDASIPIETFETEIQEILRTRTLLLGIGTLEETMATESNESRFELPLHLSRFMKSPLYEGGDWVALWIPLPKSLIAQVLNSIRDKLHSFLLDIGKTHPHLFASTKATENHTNGTAMAKRLTSSDRGKTSEEELEPRLLIPRSEAEEKITSLIEKAQEIRNRTYGSDQALTTGGKDMYKWLEYTQAWLRKVFSSRKVADELNSLMGGRYSHYEEDLRKKYDGLKHDLEQYIGDLESINDRLEIYESESSSAILAATVTEAPLSRDVFIVHGRNDHAKEVVARFIQQLDLKPIILHEQTSGGRTVIEKFEAYSNVGYAVILLTPDDIGGLRSEVEAASDPPAMLANMKPRARQNVVLELGYFIAKLGRAKVCALVEDEVEIPSDLGGFVYETMDKRGAWKLALAREIRDSGITVDLNKV